MEVLGGAPPNASCRGPDGSGKALLCEPPSLTCVPCWLRQAACCAEVMAPCTHGLDEAVKELDAGDAPRGIACSQSRCRSLAPVSQLMAELSSAAQSQ